MDLATVIGLALGNALVLLTMLLSGSLLMFWDVTSIIIVIGGAFSATMIGWPLSGFIAGLSAAVGCILNKVDPPNEIVDEIIDLANTARKESILALEKVDVKNDFLSKARKLAVDGMDPKDIHELLELDIVNLRIRLRAGRGVFEDLAEMCPAFGMIGTVIGLIVIMANIADPSKIGPGLAVALVTTLYGSLVSNMFCIPLSKKLKVRAVDEVKNCEIVRDGMAAMLKGENPRTIRDRLNSYLDEVPEEE